MAEAALLTNLVSYWKLDESSGDAVDAHGTNTLTNIGTMTYSASKINNGGNPSTTGPKYLTIADASQSGLDLSGDLTFAFWINPTSVTDGNYHMIIDKNSDGSQAIFSIRHNNTNLYFAGGAINDGFSTLTAGTLQHICLSFVASSGIATFVKNGVSLGTKSGYPASWTNNTEAFQVGNGQAGTVAFNGQLDEVGIWSRALSVTECDSIYNGGSGLEYPFGEGAAGILTSILSLVRAFWIF